MNWQKNTYSYEKYCNAIITKLIQKKIKFELIQFFLEEIGNRAQINRAKILHKRLVERHSGVMKALGEVTEKEKVPLVVSSIIASYDTGI